MRTVENKKVNNLECSLDFFCLLAALTADLCSTLNSHTICNCARMYVTTSIQGYI